ncbi:MAG: DNA-directed RNA polymerase subunit beta', partial [Bacteroidales bacterium]|nr:DNA-directed RNA polymerase subunit beta' [Bacteroidales bacterium]
GFNSVYMMLDSGARGSKEQISQLCGMRGLMAKPQKSGTGASEIIENPILANFKEGLSILEYFISSHGARKGLADTALKTADAGYLTRRLVDVAHDVIITEEDCGTLRGLEVSELRKDDGELIESLYDRILGRISVHDVFHPQTNELIVASGEEITEDIAKIIADSPIEKVEIRSVLTCESHRGVCAKCYGRNLATHRMVQKGEAVGVIAAQSIGEPGTQLTLRTFHSGGIAGNIASESTITAKYDGILEIDELRTVVHEEEEGNVDIVVTRMAELKILDPGTKIALVNKTLPYGSRLYFKNGDLVKKGDKICEWDQYNIVIISEYTGKLVFEDVVEGVNFKQEIAPQTGFIERIITETKDKSKIPVAKIVDKNKEVLAVYNLPVGARLMKNEKDQIKAGDILIKMPKVVGKGGDITGGLPRVTELFEARNPSNPAVVSEIDGVVQFGKVKRGNREIEIVPKEGNSKKYLVPLSKQILVQPNDYIKAGTPLIDGAITPSDILAIKGPTAVQEYLVNEIQDVYRLQGVKINNKHFEVIVRQMMRKVLVEDPGDTQFLENQVVDKWEFRQENDSIFDKKVVVDAGDSENFTAGQIVSYRRLRDENSMLKRKDKKLVEARPAIPATSSQVLQGITKAALQTSSFMSAASFQETTKVLNEAAIRAKEDTLEGMKENVICGHLIPAGTGLRDFQSLRVCNKAEVAPYLETIEQNNEI